MAVYRTRGCAYDKNGMGCSMCNFSHYAVKNIGDENIINQHKQILTQLEIGKYDHFDLLTLGNFFNDDEISPPLREKFLRPLSQISTLRRVLVESRYQYITEQKLSDAKAYLRHNQILEFALGYESVNEEIRNKLLNKGVAEEHLDETLRMCQRTGLAFVAYVLIKPHTLSEREGILEASRTAIHVLKKGLEAGVNTRIALEPVFVTHGKEVERYFREGRYNPPKLWSVIDVLRLTIEGMAADFKKGSLFVGLSDEYLSDDRTSSNCGRCDDKVIEAIEKFNGSQNIDELLKVQCDCKAGWTSLVSEPATVNG
jgi:radical SAM enzyme (TIGR01210 family)